MNEISAFNPTGVDIDAPETMPHSIEAEQQLLGAILTNNDIYDRVAGIINEAHFYDPVHARIYEVAASRIAKNALASIGPECHVSEYMENGYSALSVITQSVHPGL